MNALLLSGLTAISSVSPAFAQGEVEESRTVLESTLEREPENSLAHYRLGELYLREKDYQNAANEFRECINGDQKPQWTLVWGLINLGKIYDLVGQRFRAIEQYQLALRTRDDTQGAQAVAERYLKERYAVGR